LKYRKEFNIVSPILVDGNGYAAKAYGIWNHPVSFFINRDGKIVARKLGGNDWTSVETKNLIQHLLKERK